jgi:hypothetical protein
VDGGYHAIGAPPVDLSAEQAEPPAPAAPSTPVDS